MYSRKEHAERLAATFGFECAACRAEIARSINVPGIGAIVVARRVDGLFRIGATTVSPVEYVRELSRVSKREHVLVHSISVLDTRALEGHLQRQLDPFLDERRMWYALPPAVVDAICAKSHFCEVPSPYLTGAATAGFDSYLRSLEREVRGAIE
jgi:hypothetical protein